MKKNIKNLQTQVMQNITNNIPKRKYIKKVNVDPIPNEPAAIIISPEITNVNNNSSDIQSSRENNLKKARDARQEYLNNKQSDKESKINELVEEITRDKIEKIHSKSALLKNKLMKLI